MGRPSKWSPEFRQEAVRLYRDGSESIPEVARRLGLNPETFRKWVRQAEIESGEREGLTREEKTEIRDLHAKIGAQAMEIENLRKRLTGT